jgi:hypothetical protein
VSAAEPKPPPSPPDEHQFRDLAKRLLRVTKEEIDQRERDRPKRKKPKARPSS